MIVPEGYSAPIPPSRRPSAGTSTSSEPLASTSRPLPPPIRQSSTVNPAPHWVEIPLESRSLNGRKLIIASYTQDYVTVCPTSPNASQVVLTGTITVKAGKSVENVELTLIGLEESSKRPEQENDAEASPKKKDTKPKSSSQTFLRVRAQNLARVKDITSTSAGALVQQFSIQIPTKLRDVGPLPPSMQRTGFAIRYFIQVSIKRKRLTIRKSSSDCVGIVYLPMHASPPALAPDHSSQTVQHRSEKGSPALPPKNDLYTIVPLSLPDQGLEIAVMMPYGLTIARGHPFEIRLKVSSISLTMANKIVPGSWSIKLKDAGQKQSSTVPPSTISKGEVSFFPADVISYQLPSTGPAEVRAFNAIVQVPEDACPTFAMPNGGPQAQYTVEIVPKFAKGTHVITSPVTIVNTRAEGYTLPKAYFKRSGKTDATAGDAE